MSAIEAKILEVLKQTAEVEIPDPPPIPKPIPKVEEPTPIPPRSVGRGVEFSILGLGTDQKKIAVVVDMSGSMRAHSANVVSALEEIMDQMKPDNEFVIMGYRGGPTYDSYPPSGRMTQVNNVTLAGAKDFISAMPRRFGGGTPTQKRLF